MYFANVKNGNPTEGMGKELEIIAAVVLGGGSLSGGRGSVLGTVVGALIITVIRSGCALLSIPKHLHPHHHRLHYHLGRDRRSIATRISGVVFPNDLNVWQK